MTELQKRFADEYLIDSHISRAAKRAGIQGDNARITAWQMLQNEEVQAYIEAGLDDIAKRCKISQDEWLLEWKKLGFSDIKNYVEDDFSPKKLSEAKDTPAIKSVKRIETTSEDGFTKVTTEVTLHDKVNALVNIGKHLGWYEKDNDQSKPVINVPAPVVYNEAPPLSETENEVDV